MMARSVPLHSPRGLISLLALIGSFSIFFGGWLLSDLLRDPWLFVAAGILVLLFWVVLLVADKRLRQKEPRPEKPTDPYGQVTVEFGSK